MTYEANKKDCEKHTIFARNGQTRVVQQDNKARRCVCVCVCACVCALAKQHKVFCQGVKE